MGIEMGEFHANEEFEEIVRPESQRVGVKKSWNSTQKKKSKKC